MKRIFIVFILIFALLICLPSCDDSAKHEKAFANLNALTSQNYSSYVIEINVKSNDSHEVTEFYRVNIVDGVKTVNYQIETLNSFVIDGDNITVPESYKTTTKGTLTASESEKAKYALPIFNFSNDTLTVDEYKDYGTQLVLQAHVTSPEGFMGRTVNGSDIKVSAVYTNENIEYLIISFVNGKNTTEITYTFN